MRAIQITQYGGPEVMQLQDVPEPEPGPGEVLIRVEVSSVNFHDVFLREGLFGAAFPFPVRMGLEVAGTVEALGDGVDGHLHVGTRVAAISPREGGYAEMVVVPAATAIPIPDRMEFEEAGALLVNYLTAHAALHHMARLREGERVLIHAAAGGVGTAAVQLAKAAGAEIYGTASAWKHDFLREQGVDHPIDYRTVDFEEEVERITSGAGVHVVLDGVGEENYQKSYRALGAGGRLVIFGMTSEVPGDGRSGTDVFADLDVPQFSPLGLMSTVKAVMGVSLILDPGLSGPWIEDLFRLHETGAIKPHIDTRFQLEEAAQAHRYIQDRKNRGKVLIMA